MLNLKQLIQRYKGKIPHLQSVMGYLRWGGSGFYLINSSEPLNLNRDSFGFILNEHEQVHILSEANVISKRTFYTDNTYDVESETKTEFYLDESQYEVMWGKTLDHYYPHPYYEKKKVIAYEVIREMPLAFIGDVFLANIIMNRFEEVPDKKYGIEIGGTIKLTKEVCNNYPEFFKPIYNYEL